MNTPLVNHSNQVQSCLFILSTYPAQSLRLKYFVPHLVTLEDVLEDALKDLLKDALEENYNQRTLKSDYDSDTIVVNILQL